MRHGVVLMILFCVTTFAEGLHARGATTMMASISSFQIITEKLKSGEISKVDIFEMSAHLLTRTRVTPEMLERQFRYKLTVADVQSWPLRDQLLARLQAGTVAPTEREPDLRWGLVFYDMKEARIGGIYFDKTGRFGYIDNVRVTFTGSLFGLLEREFTSCFR
jgi:hypothetical protein